MTFPKAIKHMTFKTKIAAFLTIMAILMVSFASISMAVFEIREFKKDLQQSQANILNVVSVNLAAPLVFDDQAAIDEALMVFEKLPDVTSVTLVDEYGAVRSQYDKAQTETGRKQ